MITPESLEALKKDVSMAIELLKMDKEWTAESISGKVDILQTILALVEKTAKEFGGMTGEEKKKLAVDMINSLLDIPILPEWVEAKIIEYLIDVVIALLNKWFGHTWLDKFLNK